LPAGTRLDVVLKADAYGHWPIPIGHALEAGTGAIEAGQARSNAPPDGLAVATFDEVVELREAGLPLPIWCSSRSRPNTQPKPLGDELRSPPATRSCSIGRWP
jgi:alanine racemase